MKEEPPIIEIAADIVLPRIGISLDAKYIQKEQCIATIKEIAKKYNKTLEENI